MCIVYMKTTIRSFVNYSEFPFTRLVMFIKVSQNSLMFPFRISSQNQDKIESDYTDEDS